MPHSLPLFPGRPLLHIVLYRQCDAVRVASLCAGDVYRRIPRLLGTTILLDPRSAPCQNRPPAYGESVYLHFERSVDTLYAMCSSTPSAYAAVVGIWRSSVIHHIVSLAGVKGRAVAARYYLDQIFIWIAQHQGGDFRSIVGLQDEHGDTALNIAARVGNRSLVRTLLDVGANRILPNKLGLRPGDFGVETEVSNFAVKLRYAS